MVLRGHTAPETKSDRLLLLLRLLGRGGRLGRQGLQDGVHLLRHGRQDELKLLLGGHHARPLVPQVLQGGRYVYLLRPLGHPAEDHVYEAVGSRPAGAVAAVDDDGAGPAAVGLVDFPPELQEGLGGRRDAGFRPGEEVELGDGAGFACAGVFQVEGSYQVVVAPDVFAYKMYLMDRNQKHKQKVKSL